jgi:flavin reductase (DIM6/NTAB) family NADH-FMN oxidoreductase RutF
MFNFYQSEDIQNMDKDFRTQLINHLSGFKSANLIGTVNNQQLSNLAIFSSVVHLGANPPLVGMVSRPFAEGVSRHTYNNLIKTGFYTINHVGGSFTEQAHQTSARYDSETSEFKAVGLTEQYIGQFPAPFVAESNIKIGLRYLQTIDIELNNTKLIIGEIVLISLLSHCVAADGRLDLIKADTVSVSGLDTYHKATFINTYPYAKAKK